jgi:hypothetical protein
MGVTAGRLALAGVIGMKGRGAVFGVAGRPCCPPLGHLLGRAGTVLGTAGTLARPSPGMSARVGWVGPFGGSVARPGTVTMQSAFLSTRGLCAGVPGGADHILHMGCRMWVNSIQRTT